MRDAGPPEGSVLHTDSWGCGEPFQSLLSFTHSDLARAPRTAAPASPPPGPPPEPTPGRALPVAAAEDGTGPGGPDGPGRPAMTSPAARQNGRAMRCELHDRRLLNLRHGHHKTPQRSHSVTAPPESAPEPYFGDCNEPLAAEGAFAHAVPRGRDMRSPSLHGACRSARAEGWRIQGRISCHEGHDPTTQPKSRRASCPSPPRPVIALAGPAFAAVVWVITPTVTAR